MIVLGIDIGLRKGSAWAAVGGIDLYSGTLKSGAVDDAAMAHEQAEALRRVIAEQQALVVAMESQFGQLTKNTTEKERDGMTHAALRLAFVRGALAEAAMTAGCTVIEVAPATVKKAVTGNGRASKQQVQEAIARQFGVHLSQDRADAAATAIAGASRARAQEVMRAAKGVAPGT